MDLNSLPALQSLLLVYKLRGHSQVASFDSETADRKWSLRLSIIRQITFRSVISNIRQGFIKIFYRGSCLNKTGIVTPLIVRVICSWIAKRMTCARFMDFAMKKVWKYKLLLPTNLLIELEKYILHEHDWLCESAQLTYFHYVTHQRWVLFYIAVYCWN